MPVNTPAIEVTTLTKSFGYLCALRKIDLTVKTGEFLTIFGPNGAGKTTLVRILATLTKASSGSVCILGLMPAAESEAIRRQIGVIGHQTFLYGDLSAEENLWFYGKLFGVKSLEKRITDSLIEVGLSERRDGRVRTFSRGMQQRLAIARAMLHQPSILLLDEPYTGLDQHAALILSDWLVKLRQENRTTLLITHNIERGIELADRIVVLRKGELIYDKKSEGIDAEKFKRIYNELVTNKRA